ncbi:MAG: hypothetical protein CVT95_05660 [Bacteroidetes bacterium HGW-Bacteroidetes-12]|nr:MAG: hypothetical protein CVT95_05660 [Bacteroidetes bacterium HGW-Bacteroidetes-12]
MRLLIIISFIFIQFNSKAQVSGKIIDDKTGLTLPGVNVYIPATQQGVATNEKGEFLLKNGCEKGCLLQIQFIGYEKKIISISLDALNLPLIIRLKEGALTMDEIVISSNLYQTTSKIPYQVAMVTPEMIQQEGNISLMDVIAERPGVDQIKFGPGIGKPVIRGLSFSRVLTIYNGLRLDNHQWGADHGLGVNSTGVGGVEVIKGPASIIFGSGALGGVVNILDEPIPAQGKQNTYFLNTLHSNNLGVKTELGHRAASKKGWFWSWRSAYETHADYTDGNKRTIGNSRFNNNVHKFDVGVIKKWGTSKISYHYISQKLGIISDNEMVTSLETHRNDRTFQLPWQEVTDKIITSQSAFFLKNSVLNLKIGYHTNQRLEIESDEKGVDLGLKLNTSSYDVNYKFSPLKKLDITIGSQGNYQENTNLNMASKILLPNATHTDLGIFALIGYEYTSWNFLIGSRYDSRKLNVSTEKLTNLQLINNSTTAEKQFSGFTGSFGATKKLTETLLLKASFSNGFRAPDLAELFSNGQHPGTNRFELGNSEFSREENYELDLGLELKFDKLRIAVTGFYNQINNYIFFKPTNEIRNSLMVWTFNQSNALLIGAETELIYKPFKKIEFSNNLAYVNGKEANGTFLPLIPPFTSITKVSYEYQKINFSVKHRFADAQTNVADDEEATTSYHLIDAAVQKEFTTKKLVYFLQLTAANVFNTNYLNHLALIRPFDINQQGRNFRLTVMVRYY